MSGIIHLNENIKVCQNIINTGIVVRNNSSLLINCGWGSYDIIQDYFTASEINQINKILFTDYFSDKTRDIHKFADNNTLILLPAGAEDYFVNTEQYWHDDNYYYHQYNNYQNRFLIGNSILQHLNFKTITDGDEINWQDLVIKVITTPGITDCALSFLVELEGNRYCFTGDIILNQGQLINIYYLQQGKNDLMDYHGFAGRINDLKQSLQKLVNINPDILIPARGEMIDQPTNDIHKLLHRLDDMEKNYYEISSLRHWFNDTLYKDDIKHIKFKADQPQLSLPDWVLELKDTTTRGIKARDGNLFLIDCGQEEVIEKLKQRHQQQKIQDIDCVWITHYHDDHVDFINKLKQEFSCDIYTITQMAKILEKPSSYSMPCLSQQNIEIDYLLDNNTTFYWKGFKLTAYYLPGQTIYHAGLLVDYKDTKIFFIGDSFTPGGIDDYCAYNRNLLGENLGYIYCLHLLKKVNPDILINQHQTGGFNFSSENIHDMEVSLRNRIKLYRKIMPYDNINCGLDPNWVHCYPYQQSVENGKLKFEVVIFNTSHIKKEYKIKPLFPYKWNINITEKCLIVPGRKEKSLKFEVDILDNIINYSDTGYGVIGINVKQGSNYFPDIAKAIINLQT